MADIPHPSVAEQQVDASFGNELVSYLHREVSRLTGIIHRLSDPESAHTTEHVKLIFDLGSAAYHLSLAREQVQAGPIVLGPSSAEDAQTLLPRSATLRRVPQRFSEAATIAPSPHIVSTPELALDAPATPEDEASPETDHAPSDASITFEALVEKLNLAPRELRVARLLFDTIPLGQWFKRIDLGLGRLDFPSPAAEQVAWSTTSRKLTAGDVLERKGPRNNPLYRLFISLQNDPGTAEDAHSSPVPAEEPYVATDAPQPERTVESSPPVQAALPAESTNNHITVEPPPLHRESPADVPAETAVAAIIAGYMNEYRTAAPKLVSIRDRISAVYNLPSDKARQLINTVIESGQYHIESPKGTRVLVKGTADNKPSAASPKEVAVDPMAWTPDDVEISWRALALLRSAAQSGIKMTLKEVQQNVGTDFPAERVGLALKKLSRKGYINVTVPVPARRGQRLPSGIADPTVSLQNQIIKSRLENDPSGVKAELGRFVVRKS